MPSGPWSRGGGGFCGRIVDEFVEADRDVEFRVDDEAEGHVEADDLGELPGQRLEETGLDGAARMLVTDGEEDEGVVDESLGESEVEEALLMSGEVGVLIQGRDHRLPLADELVLGIRHRRSSLLSIVFVARSTPVHDFHTVFHSLWRSDESAGRYSTRVDKRVENYMIVTCGRRESTRR